jgi:M6 family metalloprotease-like protein
MALPAISALALGAPAPHAGAPALPASAFATHLMPPAPWYVGPTYGRDFAGLADVPVAAAGVTPSGLTATTGTAKVLALAIEFTDVKHQGSSTTASIESRMTGSNSMKTYFSEVSNSKLDVAGEASGWYAAQQTMAYYGAPYGGSSDSQHFDEIVAEAVQAADDSVDFSQYDTNYDRVIDNLIIVHAGPDEATGGGENAIWSKQSYYPGTLRVDGVYVGFFLTVSEGSPVGVYCHEFGHMLGLPDLYDVTYRSSGDGMWDLMASGGWGGYGTVPTHLSAWSKAYLGWVTPQTVNNYVEGLEVAQMEGAGGKVIKVPTTSSSEYFLLENREQVGYDRYLPGSGLLIWHIDQAVISAYLWYNYVNANAAHKGVDLEEGSGVQDLDTGANDGDRNDPWSSNPQGFSPTSTPNSNLYDGSDTKVRIFNISGSGSVMTIDIDFGGDSYSIIMDTDMPIRDASPGEAILYNVTVGTRSSLGDTVILSVRGPQAAWGAIPGSVRTLVLGPKGTRVVQLTVTPPAGTVKGVLGVVTLHGYSQTVPAIQSELLTSTLVRQVHLLQATPEAATVKVVPGVASNLDITVRNLGNGLENITFSLGANRSYWGAITPKKVSVPVLGTATVRASFSVPEGLLEGEREQFDLVLFVEVEGGSFEGGGTTSLRPTLDLPISMVVDRVIKLRWGNVQPGTVRPGQAANYELTIYNEGNHDSAVAIAQQVPEGWTVQYSNGGVFSIPAFGASTFNATVTAPSEVPAGSDVRINLSAAEGIHFFYAALTVHVEQVLSTRLTGQVARFADPAERVEFALNVTNLGNGPDRVTIEATDGGLWTVSVDLNFVDLGTSATSRTAPFHVIVTPPAGAEAYDEGAFHVTVTSQNGQATSTLALMCTVNPVTSFSADTEVGVDNIPPTGKAVYWVTVRNTGNLEDLYHVGLLGLPEGWTARFESRFFSVPAGKPRTVELDVTPSTGGTPVTAGTHTIRLQVASELGAGTPVELPIDVTVQTVRGYTISSLEPSYRGPSGARVLFRVLLTNAGNVRESITLQGVGDFASMSFDTPKVTLEPYGARVVNVTVGLPSTKTTSELDVRVLAISSDNAKQESVAIPVTVEGRSGLPGPSAMAATGALAVAAAAGIAAAGRRRRQGD